MGIEGGRQGTEMADLLRVSSGCQRAVIKEVEDERQEAIEDTLLSIEWL